MAASGEGVFVVDLASGGVARVRGALVLADIARIEAALAALDPSAVRAVDVAGVERIDTAGAWALVRLMRQAGIEAATGADPRHARLIAAVAAALPSPAPRAARPPRFMRTLAALGVWAVEVGRLCRDLLGYLGLFFALVGRAALRPTRFPLTPLVHHSQQVGLNAVPIVVLMAFLIGVVLAFQGATQLRRFGADVFVVDLIAISVLRELGVLLTAIIVAGRTASAFTAQLGAMKMREEIDAMRTLAIDPAEALILPRVLALVITLPVLTLLANVAGLAGGALMAWIDLGISPAMFRTRLLETSVDHVTVGMLKAPVFAVVIGLVGCHAGMQVQGSTDSLGRLTSASVVRAIFAVILIDALFSIFYSEVGL